MAKGGNVGVSISDRMLVIDVDTRGAPEGVSPIRQLEDRLGVNLSRGPLVLNGGCGQHFYFWYPDYLEIEASSPEFPGVKPRTRWAYPARKQPRLVVASALIAGISGPDVQDRKHRASERLSSPDNPGALLLRGFC